MEIQEVVKILQQFDSSELLLLGKEIHKLQRKHIDERVFQVVEGRWNGQVRSVARSYVEGDARW